MHFFLGALRVKGVYVTDGRCAYGYFSQNELIYVSDQSNWIMGILCTQLLLQFYAESLKTIHEDLDGGGGGGVGSVLRVCELA